jgi:anti-anti-sigma factor
VTPMPGPDLGSRPQVRGALLIDACRHGDFVPIAHIALSGELDMASADELDAVIRQAEETEVERIVVDLSHVSFMDSTGLSLLLAAKGRNDGRLHYIPSCHDSVTRLLQVTGTLAVVD